MCSRGSGKRGELGGVESPFFILGEAALDEEHTNRIGGRLLIKIAKNKIFLLTNDLKHFNIYFIDAFGL